MKHLVGAGLLIIFAFVVRFALSFPVALDLSVHDTYRVVPLRIVSFWALLVVAAVWLMIAVLKLVRHKT